MLGRFLFFTLLFCLSVLYPVTTEAQIQITAGEYLVPVICHADSQMNLPLYPMVKIDNESYSVIELFTPQKTRTTWGGRKLYSENFFRVDSTNYSLTVDPAVQFMAGKQVNYEPNLYENTRGIRVSGQLHNQLFFSSELYESQTVFPTYLEHFTDSFEVAPGLIRAKKFKDFGRDYATVYGTLAWSPNPHFQLMFARDKLHFGHGYRSMMLSSNAPASTFFRTSVNFKKWSYHFILSSLQNVSLKNIIDVPQSSMGGYQNKYANFMIIGFKPLHFLEISLFESMIWAPFNDCYNQLHWKHFNPFPYSRSLWYGMDDRNNTMLGLQLAAEIPYGITFYGQYVIDQAVKSMKMSALQAGVKLNKQFGNSFFSARAEMNMAGAYTYSHRDYLQSYSHYHHSLAHPFGANFKEFLIQADVHHKRWVAAGMISYTLGGVDTQLEYAGQSIYGNPDVHSWNGSLFPQLTATKSTMIFADLKIHYIVNHKNGLNLFMWCTGRDARNTPYPLKSIDIQVGISTLLRNYNKHQSWL